ncbi:hypothetical protein SESBI_37017 [Sesbania bispinosa]|nr:hypothetical protein SESBI_37017 [Sesbania bispinosa]
MAELSTSEQMQIPPSEPNVSPSGPFSWFDPKVLKCTSAFLTPNSLISITELISKRFPTNSSQILLEPCSADKYICFTPPPSPTLPSFTFVYETFFTKLNLPLPFNQFHCQILRILNVAPTQLHQNSWGFIRAFEVLCAYHNFNPSVNVFFYFFQAKLGSGRPVGWTSLNGFSGRPILVVVHSSYKDFKPRYFKLRGSDSYPNLLFSTNGEPKFPLYWTKNPNRMLGIEFNKLFDLEQQDALFLQSHYPVNCSFLLEKEGDKDALRPYIEMSKKSDSFVSQMDTKAMKAFSKVGKRKQGPQGSEATFTTQAAFLGHALESRVGLLEKELKEKIQKLKDQEEEISRAREVTAKLENLWEKLQNVSLEKGKLQGDLSDVMAEKKKSDDLLAEKSESLRIAEEKLITEQNDRKLEVNNLKAEITFQYEQGFDKAIGQVKFLYPDLNVEEVGAFKEIQDGKLVEIPDDEE